MSECRHEIEVDREVVTISLSKLQFVKQQVTFLGHVITPNSKSLSDKEFKALKMYQNQSQRNKCCHF